MPNEEAIKYRSLTHTELIVKLAQELAYQNDLIRSLIQDLMIGVAVNIQKQAPIKIFSENKKAILKKKPYISQLHQQVKQIQD